MLLLSNFLHPAVLTILLLLVELVNTPVTLCLSQPLSDDQQRLVVGTVLSHCCLPGRRWGCDPENFQQSGCKPIQGSKMKCVELEWFTMRCSGAICKYTSPEDICIATLKLVPHNRCYPTGKLTTVGCPENQWQCEVLMKDYLKPDAPKDIILVCDDTSTLCRFSYSRCD